jgi:hypothetical protein
MRKRFGSSDVRGLEIRSDDVAGSCLEPAADQISAGAFFARLPNSETAFVPA